MKLRFFLLLLFLSGPLLAAPKPYLGWVPIQFAPAGSEVILDMRRFFEPGPDGKLQVQSSESYRATYAAQDFQLKVAIPSTAAGFVEVPLRLVDGSGKLVSEAVLTIAVEVPGRRAETPSVYAETMTPKELRFRVVGGRVPTLSAVAQFPDGSSRIVKAQTDGDHVVVPTGGLPEGTWVRLAVADTSGRVSRPARAQTGETPKFRWQDGVIYYAFTDRFVNGQPSNDQPVNDPAVLPQANYFGGDFQGIQQRIEEGYFDRLGVNVLWLAPLNRNPADAWKEYLPPYRSYTGYHGYWPISHTEVEPRFGGDAGLASMVTAARKSEIKIIADLVLRHTHAEHPLRKEKPEWFGELMLPDGSKNLRIWDEQQFTTWFEEWLPGFDFDKPEPVAFLLDNASFWARKFHLDGFRLDAVKHIKPSFWWKFRTAMRKMEQADQSGPMYFVGETFMDRQGIMQFVGPNMLDGQFDFPLYDTIMEVLASGKAGLGTLEESLSASETIYGKETLMSPLVGNHDKSRFMAFADGDLPDPKNDDEEEIGWANPPKVDHQASYEKLKLALSFILSIDGVPMIYYGDEVGLTGAGDPDNRRMMPTENELAAEQKAVREHFGQVAKLRAAHAALRYGHRRLLLAEDFRYAFVRRHFDDAVLAVWNTGKEDADFDLVVAPELADGDYHDAITGKNVEVREGRAKFSVGSMKSAFLVAGKP